MNEQRTGTVDGVTRAATPWAAASRAAPIAFYETVAQAYADRLNEVFFARPAVDLVRVAGVAEGDIVLDAGTGTGVVAEAARHAAGRAGRVVGLDGARAMLGRATTGAPQVACVQGDAHRPPLAPQAFDVVVGGFVLSHLALDDAGISPLADLVRARGTVALSMWSPVEPPAAQPWAEAAARYVELDDLRLQGARVAPHEEALTDPDRAMRVFDEANLARVRVTEHRYPVDVEARAFVQLTAALPGGALVARRLGPDRWKRFEDEATEAIEEGVGERVQYELGVRFVVGRA